MSKETVKKKRKFKHGKTNKQISKKLQQNIQSAYEKMNLPFDAKVGIEGQTLQIDICRKKSLSNP